MRFHLGVASNYVGHIGPRRLRCIYKLALRV